MFARSAAAVLTGAMLSGALVIGAAASAVPASAATGGTAAGLKITPGTVAATSGQCVTFTVTELAADGKRATSGQFTPTVTLGGGTIATYGTPTPGPLGGLPPACTDSTVSASGTSGSVFTFGVVTQDLLDTPETTTIDVANSADTLSASATESVGQLTPTAVSLAFGAPASAFGGTTCPTSTTDPMTATGTAEEVCARVTATNGLQAVAGAPVTFTVDSGTVAGSATDAAAPTATTTYSATSDASGVADAFILSTGPRAQTVTAAAGTGSTAVTSDPLTDTYQGPNVAAAALALTPKTATIASGGSQKFTATVTDTSGTGVPDVPIAFRVYGDGSIAGGITASVTTRADGTAVVTISTQLGSTAAGAGSLTASAGTPAGTAATSTAKSTYKILAKPKPKRSVATALTLTSPKKHQLSEVARLSPKLGKVSVHFFTVSHGKRTYVGRATTNSRGVAHLTLTHLTSRTTVTATARPVSLPTGYRAGKYAPTVSHKVT